LVAVVDIESGTWKIAREMFELLQKEMDSKKKTVKLQNQTKYKSDIEDLGGIKAAVSSYQKRLMATVSGIENERKETVSMPQQAKSVSKR
jgi:hypothetical protein